MPTPTDEWGELDLEFYTFRDPDDPVRQHRMVHFRALRSFEVDGIVYDRCDAGNHVRLMFGLV
jgi:hypothetical protein